MTWKRRDRGFIPEKKENVFLQDEGRGEKKPSDHVGGRGIPPPRPAEELEGGRYLPFEGASALSSHLKRVGIVRR